MHGVRASHPHWTVWRLEADEYGGSDPGWFIVTGFWSEAEAVAERERLEKANTNEAFSYTVTEGVATVVYPSDEPPPWVDDPERLKRRGYELLPDDAEL